MEILKFISELWKFLLTLGPTVSALIIVIGFLYILHIKGILDTIIGGAFLKAQNKWSKEKELKDEEVHKDTLEIIPQIQEVLEDAAMLDPTCKAVMFLNYHNGTRDLTGFSYMFLDRYAHAQPNEAFERSIAPIWEQLRFSDYSKELREIKVKGGIFIDDIEDEDFKLSFTRLYKKIKASGGKSVGIYPLQEYKGMPKGLVIFIYSEPKSEKDLKTDFYKINISPLLQKLAILITTK